MKKLKLMALGLLSVGMFTLTSCEDDTDEVFPDPTLTVTASATSVTGDANGDIQINSNETVSFTIAGASAGGTDLKSIALVISGVNVVSPIPETDEGYDLNSVANLSNSDEDIYNDVLTIDGIFFSNEGVTNYRFTLTDNNDQTTVVDIAVTVDNPTPLNTEVIGAFYHVAGSLQGAYNLVAATPVSGATGADNTVQDMKNTDAAGDIFTGSWTAGNQTSFVKDNSFDYDGATEEMAAAAYAAGTAGGNVNDPFIGDIYIAKLRGGSDYAVIQITDVDPTDNTCNCGNLGKISFDFKKK
jgi:hypothetical protein